MLCWWVGFLHQVSISWDLNESDMKLFYLIIWFFWLSWVIKGWWHQFGSVVYGPELRRPHRWQKCKQTAKNGTYYRFPWHHPLITQLTFDLFFDNCHSLVLQQLCGPHFVFQKENPESWFTWFFSSWERNNCLQSWANLKNDTYFHSKQHPRRILNKNSHFVNLLSLANNHLQDWKVNFFLSFSGER